MLWMVVDIEVGDGDEEEDKDEDDASANDEVDVEIGTLPLLWTEEDAVSIRLEVVRLLARPVSVSLPVAAAAVVIVKLFSTTGGMSKSPSSEDVAIAEALTVGILGRRGGGGGGTQQDQMMCVCGWVCVGVCGCLWVAVGVSLSVGVRLCVQWYVRRAGDPQRVE